MIFFSLFAFAALLIIVVLILINNLIVKKNQSCKVKGIFRLLVAIIISLIAGGAGFFLTFAIGEGLVEVLSEKISMLVTFGSVSIFNFIVCLLTVRFYPKSIWFSWFLVNIIVWVVIIMNPGESGGFVDLWWGWTAPVIFALAGSVAGFLLSKKKIKQSDTAQNQSYKD